MPWKIVQFLIDFIIAQLFWFKRGVRRIREYFKVVGGWRMRNNENHKCSIKTRHPAEWSAIARSGWVMNDAGLMPLPGSDNSLVLGWGWIRAARVRLADRCPIYRLEAPWLVVNHPFDGHIQARDSTCLYGLRRIGRRARVAGGNTIGMHWAQRASLPNQAVWWSRLHLSVWLVVS